MVAACKPSVWGWLAPEVCCEGGPQPAHLPCPGNDFSKHGRREGGLRTGRQGEGAGSTCTRGRRLCLM